MEKIFEKFEKVLNPEELIKKLLPMKFELTIFEKDGTVWIKIEYPHRKTT